MERRAFLQLPTLPEAEAEDLFAYWARQAPPLFRIGPEHENSRLVKLLGQATKPSHPATAKNGQTGLEPLKIEAGLETYADVLDRTHAAHLLRRATGSVHPDQLAEMIGKTAEEAADELVASHRPHRRGDRPAPRS